jgi:hypothetical protein
MPFAILQFARGTRVCGPSNQPDAGAGRCGHREGSQRPPGVPARTPTVGALGRSRVSAWIGGAAERWGEDGGAPQRPPRVADPLKYRAPPIEVQGRATGGVTRPTAAPSARDGPTVPRVRGTPRGCVPTDPGMPTVTVPNDKQYRRYMKNHGSDRMTFDDS